MIFLKNLFEPNRLLLQVPSYVVEKNMSSYTNPLLFLIISTVSLFVDKIFIL